MVDATGLGGSQQAVSGGWSRADGLERAARTRPASSPTGASSSLAPGSPSAPAPHRTSRSPRLSACDGRWGYGREQVVSRAIDTDAEQVEVGVHRGLQVIDARKRRLRPALLGPSPQPKPCHQSSSAIRRSGLAVGGLGGAEASSQRMTKKPLMPGLSRSAASPLK
jgi:hypothetical protein